MAKKKTTKPEKASAKKSKSKQPTLEANRSFTPDEAAARPGTFSAEEIGHTAGDVWGLLNADGGMTLATLKKTLAAPSDLVLAAVGWLAREDKLEFTAEGRGVKISLR
jgi:hypothetical protein